ncbi:hypothetical protein FGO68_gene8975 [Halteria grandinella]|uniref:Uncharacterized protein n=1 Tax=Halteria grandinella TaxID=5974 RepID=A0A8J8NEU9_HALGN|nr:hypothetical protein FGO68_gene8975 [Halteria grandinella]
MQEDDDSEMHLPSPGFHQEVVEAVAEEVNHMKEELNDFTEKQNQANMELQVDISDLRLKLVALEEKQKADLEQNTELMKTTVSEECLKMKNDITGKYDTLMTRHSEVINEMVERRKKELAETQQLFDKANKNVFQNDRKMDQMKSLFMKQVNMQKQILESMAILNIVMQQDEEDKKQIALYGLTLSGKLPRSQLRKTKAEIEENDEKPLLKIDQNCFTCSKSENQTSLKNAFKIACLAYTPKQIAFGGQAFLKEELLTRSMNLIEKSFSDFIFQNREYLNTDRNFNESMDEDTRVSVGTYHPGVMMTSIQDYLAKQFKPIPQSVELKHTLSTHHHNRSSSQPLILPPLASGEGTTFDDRIGLNHSVSRVSFMDNLQHPSSAKKTMLDFDSQRSIHLQMIESKTKALVKEGIFHKLNLDYNISLANGREQMKRASTPLLTGSTSGMVGLNKKKLIMSKIHIDDSKKLRLNQNLDPNLVVAATSVVRASMESHASKADNADANEQQRYGYLTRIQPGYDINYEKQSNVIPQHAQLMQQKRKSININLNNQQSSTGQNFYNNRSSPSPTSPNRSPPI